MTDLRYDYSKAKAAGEAAGLVWMDAMVPVVDEEFAAMNPPLTQDQVDALMDLYIRALVTFTTGAPFKRRGE